MRKPPSFFFWNNVLFLFSKNYFFHFTTFLLSFLGKFLIPFSKKFVLFFFFQISKFHIFKIFTFLYRNLLFSFSWSICLIFFSEFCLFIFQLLFFWEKKEWHLIAIVDVSISLTVLSSNFENSLLLWSRSSWTYKTAMNSPLPTSRSATNKVFFLETVKMNSKMMLLTSINKNVKLQIIWYI